MYYYLNANRTINLILALKQRLKAKILKVQHCKAR